MTIRMVHEFDREQKAPRTVEVFFPPFHGYERKRVDLIWGVARYALDLRSGRLCGRGQNEKLAAWCCRADDLAVLREAVRQKRKTA